VGVHGNVGGGHGGAIAGGGSVRFLVEYPAESTCQLYMPLERLTIEPEKLSAYESTDVQPVRLQTYVGYERVVTSRADRR
jgi:predicted outer membrane repeat protein